MIFTTSKACKSEDKVEGLQSTFTAENLELVDVLVTTVGAGSGKTFRVLVGQDGSIGLHGGLNYQILGVL